VLYLRKRRRIGDRHGSGAVVEAGLGRRHALPGAFALHEAASEGLGWMPCSSLVGGNGR